MKQLEGDDIKVTLQPTQPWLSDTDSPRCKDGIFYAGHLRATGPDNPGVVFRLTQLLAESKLDITSLECKQHVQHDFQRNELQNMFLVSGQLRSFTPVDRAELEEKVIAFEKREGVRLGIVETEPDHSFSALASADAKPSRLRTFTTK